MKIYKTLLLAAATMVAFSANAQELKKTVLGVEGFTYSSSFSPADVEVVRNQVINAINNTGRVIVVDHNSSTNRALQAESERRKQESAMDANTVADMGTLNANSLIFVHLDQITTSEETYVDYEYVKNSEGKTQKKEKGRYPFYKATITYTVKITDCQTGSVQAQESYSYSEGRFNSTEKKSEYPSEKAVRDALIRKCVSNDAFTILILNTFKAQGKVLQVEDGNDKKAKTVFVSLGSDDGITAGQKLEVYKEIDVAGETSRKLIGEVEVIEILSKSRCLCKVKSGGNVIQQVISVGGNLPVLSKDVKIGFWGVK